MQKYISPTLAIFLSLLIGINAFGADSKKANKATDSPPKVVLSDENKRLFDYYFYEAMNAKAIGKLDSSYDLLSYCYQIDSTNANLLFELGNYQTLLQDKEAALDYYRKAVSYVTNNYHYDMALASLSLELKQYPEAVDLFNTLVKNNPDKIDLYLYLSESYRLNNNIPDAIKTLNALENIVGLNERISFQKFQLYSAIDKKKEAYAEMQKYIDKYPNEIKYPLFLGNLYMLDNKTKEALAAYDKAKTIDPENPSLVLAMANYYEQTGDKEAADNELHSALFNPKIDIDTKLGILAQYVGTLEQRKQTTERVNSILTSLMEEYPQEARLNSMYGDLLMLQNKKQEAYFQYQIYTESDPTNLTGWEQMLKTVFPDSVKKSIQVCESAISYNPTNPVFYLYLGVGYYMDKNYEKAIYILKQGLNYVDEAKQGLMKSEFYGQIGDIYHQTAREDSAFVQYEKALKYNPQNLGVLNNYSYYLSVQKKDLDRAEKMSSITIKAEPTNSTFLDTYGWILFEQGAYNMAKIYLENAVKYSEEKGTASNEIYEHYGDVLYKTDEKEKALEYWKKAKEKGDSDSKTLDKKIETKTYIE
ncbi:MAG: tetratricopeptide repeat protein [Dysgonomonas sp.]